MGFETSSCRCLNQRIQHQVSYPSTDLSPLTDFGFDFATRGTFLTWVHHAIR